jgi:4-hydroxybenzoate polyprenyltransferase
MRSAGCAINDIADRGFDRYVERTRARPLACGALAVREALLVFALLCSLSLLLVLELNFLTIGLAFAGVALAAIYPFVKRISHFPQTVLGIAFGWGAVMAWSAVKGSISAVPLLIFFANICWSMAYDTLYALVDRDDDLKIGVKSTAIYFGTRVYTAVTVMYFGVAAFLLTAGVVAGLGALYYLGVAVALFVFLFIVRAVKGKNSREAAFNGFLQNAVVGAMLLFFVILDLNLSGVMP